MGDRPYLIFGGHWENLEGCEKMETAHALIFILIFHQGIVVLHAAGWSYAGSKGPSNWYKDYAECGEKKQSPINLPSECDLEYNKDLGPFVFSGFLDKTPINTLKNNGHAVQVDVGGHLTVTGGGLSGTHKVAQFHFHWGEDDSRGSEHFQNGIQYPLELHIVTYNMKYPDVTTAFDKADGLAVLGFFYEVGETNNINYTPLIDIFSLVKYGGNSTSFSNLKVRYLLPNKFDKFYRYQGSLTTPPCHESVTWTVFQETIYLSTEQLAVFRTLYEDETHPI